MIDIENLEVNEWYDGFVWLNNKQKRVDTYLWADGMFRNAGATAFINYRGEEDSGFEPNMVSIGEPAS